MTLWFGRWKGLICWLYAGIGAATLLFPFSNDVRFWVGVGGLLFGGVLLGGLISNARRP